MDFLLFFPLFSNDHKPFNKLNFPVLPNSLMSECRKNNCAEPITNCFMIEYACSCFPLAEAIRTGTQ